VEWALYEYETRLSHHGALSLFAVERYFNDAAAIDAAKNLRKSGGKIEVWRGDDCVYMESPRENPVSP
jgi:hypothetical protein